MNGGWNPWHGCHKYSEGCANCYVYRMDARHDKDSSLVTKTQAYDLPLRHARDGSYKLKSSDGVVYTCFTSDFFVEDADEWRPGAWAMMRERSDLQFMFITKRILRAERCLPPDWGDGYPNVAMGCTVENQRRTDERLPVFRDFPVQHKYIISEPLLERVDMSKYLGPWAASITVGGESGPEARPCDFDWVLSLREQAEAAGVKFHFKQTGAKFIKDGKLYSIPRRLQFQQARRANVDI